MRNLFALTAFHLASALVMAQQAAPGQDPNASVDTVLAGWEKSLSSLKSLYADCQRTTIDKTFNTTELFKGSAKYLKAPGPGQGAAPACELYKQPPQGPNAMIFEKYIYTGTYLYEYAPANKVIRVHDLPPPKAGQIADDNFLSFLFGMKAAEAKQRYELTLTSSDQFYYYLQIQPKLAQDKADFSVARLVLLRQSFLPRQVWFHQPNGNEVTWDFEPRRDVEIPAAAFEKPKLPSGWKLERMPAQAKAKVRGNGP